MQKKILLVGNHGPALQHTLKASISLPPPPAYRRNGFSGRACGQSLRDHLYARPRGGDRLPADSGSARQWDAIILSDIGANTLLLHPDTAEKPAHRQPANADP